MRRSTLCLIKLIPLMLLMITSNTGSSNEVPENTPAVGEAADAISLEDVSAFHVRLNEVCRAHKSGMGYCGPLAKTGRGLVMSNPKKNLYRWMVHESFTPTQTPVVILELRMTRQKPKELEFAVINVGPNKYYVVLDWPNLDPNVALKHLNGKTPKEFLAALSN
jgi:hypothetical protein